MPRARPLSSDRRAALRAFLAHPDRPEGTLSLGEVQGFLFSVACAPDLVKPSEWVPFVFGDEEPEFDTWEEAEGIIASLMDLYNEIVEPVQMGVPRLPRDCAFRDDLMANLEDDAPVAAWSRGFMIGHRWLAETWDVCLTEEMADDVAAAAMVLFYFASRHLAERCVEELAAPGTTLEEMTRVVRDIFPRAMMEYAQIGVGIYRERFSREMAARRPASAPAGPGRNDPCPCGSGRKYKKCCGGQAH